LLDALARSIAETAADVLGQRAKFCGAAKISDETVGLYLWHDRGFRDHDALVQLINATRRTLDERGGSQRRPIDRIRPVQLCLDLEAA
jgi:hypothetical protein